MQDSQHTFEATAGAKTNGLYADRTHVSRKLHHLVCYRLEGRFYSTLGLMVETLADARFLDP